MPPPRCLEAALAAALLAGCGGPADAERVRDGRLEIRLDDYSIRPQSVRAPAGSPLTFAVVNRGRLPHTFRVEDSKLRVEQSTLKPGARATVRARLPRGRYRMFCAIANHEELGMYGTLVMTR
jgi:plastocyanin